jgi:hypothetical protein
MDTYKYCLDEEEIADLVIEDASDAWICEGNELCDSIGEKLCKFSNCYGTSGNSYPNMGSGLIDEDGFADNKNVNCSALTSVVMDDSNSDEDIIMVEDELVETCSVDLDTTADVINFKECFYGDNQGLEMINNVAVGAINFEEITFFENDLILYESLFFEETTDSGLRSNIGNLCNPSIWYHNCNESLCESREGIWFEYPEKWFGEDENHPSLPVVLYSSNFSPPVYIDVHFNGNNDTSGDMLELSYPINPCQHHYQNWLTESYKTNKSLVSLENGEFSSTSETWKIII